MAEQRVRQRAAEALAERTNIAELKPMLTTLIQAER
jgi:hypothetical protein